MAADDWPPSSSLYSLVITSPTGLDFPLSSCCCAPAAISISLKGLVVQVRTQELLRFIRIPANDNQHAFKRKHSPGLPHLNNLACTPLPPLSPVPSSARLHLPFPMHTYTLHHHHLFFYNLTLLLTLTIPSSSSPHILIFLSSSHPHLYIPHYHFPFFFPSSPPSSSARPHHLRPLIHLPSFTDAHLPTILTHPHVLLIFTSLPSLFTCTPSLTPSFTRFHLTLTPPNNTFHTTSAPRHAWSVALGRSSRT